MFSPFVISVGRVPCAPGPGSPGLPQASSPPRVPASSASVTLTRGCGPKACRFRAGSLLLGVLPLSLAGCLAPAPHDDTSPTDITIPTADERLARTAIETYAQQLAGVFKSAANEPTLNPADLHPRLKSQLATARQQAFAPLDARLEETMNQTPLDPPAARKLLEDLSRGFEAGKAEKQRSEKAKGN